MLWGIVDTEYSTYPGRKFPEEDNFKELLEIAYLILRNERIVSSSSFLLSQSIPDNGVHRLTTQCMESGLNLTDYQAGKWMIDYMRKCEVVYVNGLRYDMRAMALVKFDVPNWKEAKTEFNYNHLSDFEARHGIQSPPDYLNHVAIYCCIRLQRCIIEQWRLDEICRNTRVGVTGQTQQPYIPAWTGYVIR